MASIVRIYHKLRGLTAPEELKRKVSSDSMLLSKGTFLCVVNLNKNTFTSTSLSSTKVSSNMTDTEWLEKKDNYAAHLERWCKYCRKIQSVQRDYTT